MSRRRLEQKIKKAVAEAREADQAAQAATGQGQGPAAQPGEAAPAESGKGVVPFDRLERRAMIEHWPVKAEMKPALVNRQIKIAIDPNSSTRDAQKSFMAVLAADRFNLELQKAMAGENLNVHVSGGLDMVQRTEADITVRVNEYLAEYAALQSRLTVGVEPRPRMVGQNGTNGHVE